MPYNSLIDRDDADALIPEEVSREIIKGVVEQSSVMALGKRLSNMPRGQTRMPVLGSLPIGYFVTGDTGLKKTTEIDWSNKYLDAEEIAVIVPISQNVLDDAAYDIWGEVRPLIEEEFGRVFDLAVLFGTNAPASWPTDILAAAVAAGNSVALGVGADMYEDLMDVGGVIAALETDGYFSSGAVAAMTMRARLRGLRDADGGLIFSRNVQEGNRYELDGEPMLFPRNGGFDAAQAHSIHGDWNRLVWTLRKDITYTIATEGIIQDATGAIVYNLFQQDMVALRAVMRLAWQVSNPINRLQEVEAARYPFAALIP